MSINHIQDEIIEDFELFDNWEDKYAHIIELGKKIPAMNEANKTPECRVKGCQSSVWLYPTLEAGKVFFEADSDAFIVKGLVSILLRVFSGQSPEDIAHTNLYVFEKMGMNQHLSMNRSNGLASMIKQIKLNAITFAQ